MLWETRFVDDSIIAYARCAPPVASEETGELSGGEAKFDEPRRSMTEIERRWLSREPIGSQMLEITLESSASKDAEVLDSKFHFVYVLLRKMLKSAERNWMLHEKNGYLKSQHGHAKDKTQRKLNLERRMEENQQALASALGAHDNARAGVVWLQKQYDLGLSMIKLKNELTHKHDQLEALAAANLPPKETENKKGVINHQMKQISDNLIAADKQQRALRKESLDVGLKYLDANCSGSIEPEDVPTMTAELFNMLDINKNHAITPAELQEAVSKMEANLDDLRSRRDALKDAHTKLEHKRMGVDDKGKTKVKVSLTKCCSAQEDVQEQTEVEMAMNEQKQMKLEHDIDQQLKVLQEVFRVFESSFTMNVFSKLEGWDALLALPKEGSPITCSMAAVARRPKMVERLLDATSVVTEEEEAAIGVVGPSPLYRSSTAPSTPREGSGLKLSPTAMDEARLDGPPTPSLTPLEIGQPEHDIRQEVPVSIAESTASKPSTPIPVTIPAVEPTGKVKEREQQSVQDEREITVEKHEGAASSSAVSLDTPIPLAPAPPPLPTKQGEVDDRAR